MFERPKGGERAIIVQLALPDLNVETAFAEFKELAASADAEIVATVRGTRAVPEAKYYVGLGKAEEISEQVLTHAADLVLVNHELSPSQERNLERLLQCRVVDRTGLILDIFAQRARTFEGKLQVELAQLQHLSTRLVRGWTHLERQKGGIGLRGPGEKQLETDRRLLRERIKVIRKRLEKVRQNRDQVRKARQKAAMPTISLVGYTNAGKSSLFNALTGAEIYAADKLFATLDPTMRKLELPGSAAAMLTDTVGFIRDLPHQLVDAFHATLEETKEADLLLHVIDVADPNWREHVNAVESVLKEIGADKIKRILVFNKIDLQKNWQPQIDCQDDYCKVWVSAATGAGLELLREVIAQQLHGSVTEEEIFIASDEAKLRAQLYAAGAVLQEEILEGGWRLFIRLSAEEKQRLFRKQ
ncbi:MULTISPECIES: ribosome rescue GTPase HflX [Legionella]|uniref:GTPase HflX n=1 Tax=Legionella septentrionalis TaxID=2498109 RepID=A0A433JMC9_9GAMM|nr:MULTISPECIES: ribosome rescue GTPase HflX [Legionella]MCP0914825.1 GTPase HflX [Legionella sp. 27cVA30]RUQ91040.1 GTPase HflX [Legionella septentrionalis]RUR02890.1 GTPase HflX [Legionella septentrionalis]RUR11489.1 GTPase HflX [Legionella septentrionalis]RUR16754.1 GTPase HflX [Legionella septentrionalis]